MKTAEMFEMSVDLMQRREPHAWVTVVATRRPSSAYVGAQAIVTSDGRLHGWIGGGCVHATALAAALDSLRTMTPQRLRLSNSTNTLDDADIRPMNCPSNGEVELFVQPVAVTPRLRIYGKTPAATAAAWLAREADFDPVTDADAVDAETMAMLGGSGAPPSSAHKLETYALIATQGDGDEAALENALLSTARAVLVIASNNKAERLRAAMALRGIPESRLAAVHAPAGPDIGAVTPNEIAVAAIAGLIALRRGHDEGSAGRVPRASASVEPANRLGYINPVCGAVVDPARALSSLTIEGQTHYFCCQGCRTEFERFPEKYVAIASHMRAPAAHG